MGGKKIKSIVLVVFDQHVFSSCGHERSGDVLPCCLGVFNSVDVGSKLQRPVEENYPPPAPHPPATPHGDPVQRDVVVLQGFYESR